MNIIYSNRNEILASSLSKQCIRDYPARVKSISIHREGDEYVMSITWEDNALAITEFLVFDEALKLQAELCAKHPIKMIRDGAWMAGCMCIFLEY